MCDANIIKDLLDVENRQTLFKNILSQLRSYSDSKGIHYYEFETHEGIIPILVIAKSLNPDKVKSLKVFVGAQHNEYNGLFGIIEFLKMLQKSLIQIDEILIGEQMLIFAPLMNPYGFLNPTIENKSGYHLKNGTNLNRFWRRTFAPEYKDDENDLNQYPIPEHAKIFKNLLAKYWERDHISIYILDFHETSLLGKFLTNLSNNLQKNSITYKFSHWLEEEILHNIIELNKIRFTRNPLFYKCNSDADHSHINLTIKQLDIVYQNLQDYILRNNEKLPFYFCYSNRSKEICQFFAQKVYEKLKDNLWETIFPAYKHNFTNHGCFVNLNDATIRKNVYSIELESLKQFFNIFDEIDKSKADKYYFDKKIKKFQLSTQLVVESINQMIKLF
ncbi:MAG: hypothetical protein ACFE8B_05560 [Candidatus Hermodarchaeota archaeon]